VLALSIGCGGSAPVANPRPTPVANPTPNPAPSPTTAPTPVATPTPSPSPSPTPEVITVLDNLEDTTAWKTCGNCGNTGATGATAPYSFAPGIASPSEDGASTKFSIAATVPYTNAYFYLVHAPVLHGFAQLTYSFDFFIPVGMQDAPQAFEFECQQILGGYVYNFGWQANYVSDEWRTFNYGAKAWVSASILQQHFTAGVWHHIVAEYHNDAVNHVAYFDALTVDGIRFTVNAQHPAFFSGSNNQFTNAVQLDSNGKALPYSVYIDKMKIGYR
jgi:hypothetical protein